MTSGADEWTDQVVEEILFDCFGRALVRELLTQVDASINEQMIDHIHSLCGENPWDAPAMYVIVKADLRQKIST